MPSEHVPHVELPTGLAAWGLLAEPEHSLFTKQISSFATDFGGLVFEPHVTIYSVKFPKDEIPEGIQDAMIRSLRSVRPFELEVRALDFGEPINKQAFFRLGDPDGVLGDLVSELRHSAGSPYNSDPHLSLFYGKLDAEGRELIRRQAPAPPTITIDRISIIYSPPGQTKFEDMVKAWETLFTIDLNDPPAA